MRSSTPTAFGDDVEQPEEAQSRGFGRCNVPVCLVLKACQHIQRTLTSTEADTPKVLYVMKFTVRNCNQALLSSFQVSLNLTNAFLLNGAFLDLTAMPPSSITIDTTVGTANGPPTFDGVTDQTLLEPGATLGKCETACITVSICFTGEQFENIALLGGQFFATGAYRGKIARACLNLRPDKTI